MATNGENNDADIIKSFQINESISDKSDEKYGLRIAQLIQNTLGGTTSYFFLRNSRFRKDRDMAHGRYDVFAEFADRLGFNAKINYANLMWLPFHVVNTIISRKVGAWMGRNEKIAVTAIDPISTKVRNDNYDLAELILYQKDKLAKLQEVSGLPVVPQDSFVAEDKDELDMWAEEGNHIPEEILYEKAINNISDEAGLFDVLKEKELHDSAEVGLVCLYTEMDAQGKITDYYVEPENAFYSFSKYPDFRDTTYRGEMVSMRLRDVRLQFGQEFGGKLSEEDLWELAKYCKEYQRIDKITWLSEWSTSIYRPYDEWNLDCMKFEFKSVDKDTYSMHVSEAGTLVVKKGNGEKRNASAMYGKLKGTMVGHRPSSILKSSISNVINLHKKSLKKEDVQKLKGIHSSVNNTPDLQESQINQHLQDADNILESYDLGYDTVSNENSSIWQCVYAKDAKKILKWQLKVNQIKSQDKTDLGRVDFGYSFYMYQNYDMRNIAIPEKVEEPFKNMILVRLKMQQLTMKMKPIGSAINESALRNIDYGLAGMNKDIDYKKLYEQSGDIYYNGVDAEGNPIPVPITELQNSGFLPQMQGLIQLYAHHYQVLQTELGENPELAQAASTPRVSEGNIQQSIAQGDNATDYMYDAYLYVMEEAARKKACLLNDSITYGSQVYKHILKEEDVKGRVFSVKAKMLPTAQEIANLQNQMNQAIAANPKFTQYCDTFKIIRMAKEDVKMADLFYRQSMKRMIKTETAIAQQNQQDTIQGQIASAQAAEKAKQESLKKEMLLKKMFSDAESRNRMKEIIVTGSFAVMAKGLDVKQEWMPVVNEIIKNVAMPIVSENIENEIEVLDAAMQFQEQEDSQQQQMEQQQNQQQQQGQPQQDQQQPMQQ